MNSTQRDETMDGGAIGVEVGLDVLKRIAPSGMKWLSTYVRGIELLIIGPGAAGKTCIAEYLEYGVLEDPQPHEKTHEIQPSRLFEIAIGRDQSLRLRIRRTVDVPGQTGPVDHANLIKERRPHAVLIVLDGGMPVSQIPEWLDPFCERVDHLFRQERRLVKKIKRIFVALNKRDIIRRTVNFEARKRTVRERLVSGLSEVLGRQTANRIPIMPTIAVKTIHGSTMIDALIRRIAKEIAK